MRPRFYQVLDDMSTGRRWYLASPIDAGGDEVDPRHLTEGRPVKPPGTLRLPLRRKGPPRDFTLADFDMPIATTALAREFERLAPGVVQRIPVSVEGTDGGYEIVNLTRAVKCLDESASDIQYVSDDELRPERVGTYEMVADAVIDPALAAGERLFRVAGWKIMMVCSAEIRDALAGRGYSGLVFEELAISHR